VIDYERQVAEVVKKLHNRQDILNSSVMYDDLIPTTRMTMAVTCKLPQKMLGIKDDSPDLDDLSFSVTPVKNQQSQDFNRDDLRQK
jgi:hypothetical protein